MPPAAKPPLAVSISRTSLATSTTAHGEEHHPAHAACTAQLEEGAPQPAGVPNRPVPLNLIPLCASLFLLVPLVCTSSLLTPALADIVLAQQLEQHGSAMVVTPARAARLPIMLPDWPFQL